MLFLKKCVKVYGFLHIIHEIAETGAKCHRRRGVIYIPVLFPGTAPPAIAGKGCPGSTTLPPSPHPVVSLPVHMCVSSGFPEGS